MNIEYLPLFSIPLIYFFVAFLKPLVQPKLPFNLCAICVAVSSTWLILLALWILKFSLSPIMLGILMGMSVTGIMYKLEGWYKKLKVKNFWIIRLIIMMGGLYGIYNLLDKKWSVVILIGISAFISIILLTLFFQGKVTDKVRAKNPLIKRLDNCC